MPDTPNLTITDPEVMLLQTEKESAYDFRKRRHGDMRDNYTLYRGKVIPNRLTQRQSVHVPLMKYTLQSILKDLDEPPALYFKNLDNNEQKEVYYNEYWKKAVIEKGHLVLRDIMDKKQALLYGRTFKKLNVVNGIFTFEVVDPQDMLVHRYVDPATLDSAECLIQINIFKPLSDILENDSYSKSGRSTLSRYYTETEGSLNEDGSLNEKYEKAERMQDMGLEDALDPTLAESHIELNEIYRKEYVKDEGRNVVFLYTVATPAEDFMIKLQKRRLDDVIGSTVDDFWTDHFPYSTWGTDPERLDFWSDAPADVIRVANQVLNSWFSQLIENRMLRNFNMHYYDSSNSDFVPQTFDPEPWGWYPMPGDPNKILKTVQVPDLSDSLDEMEFVKNLAERAVAATSAQTGDVESKQVTLGEVQLALANAKERVQSTAIFYTESWKDFGQKYIKMLEAAHDSLEPLEIVKEGRLGKKMYTKVIAPKSWSSKAGYTAQVQLVSAKQEADLVSLQKLDAAMAAMPNNMPLRTIRNKKLLEFADLSVEERAQVEEFESQNVKPEIDLGMEAPQPQPAMTQERPRV